MHTRETFYAGSGSIVIGKALGVCAFTVLLCFSSLVRIPLPFTPVPITLQNMVVFMSGAVLGPLLGLSSVLLYVLIGILGAPLFANLGAGPLYLFGPTGGYIFGFLFSSWLVGALTRPLRARSLIVYFGIMLIGVAVVHIFGSLWLKIGYGWDLKKIFFLGVAPFLVPDAFKAFLAAGLCKSLPGRWRGL